MWIGYNKNISIRCIDCNKKIIKISPTHKRCIKCAIEEDLADKRKRSLAYHYRMKNNKKYLKKRQEGSRKYRANNPITWKMALARNAIKDLSKANIRKIVKELDYDLL